MRRIIGVLFFGGCLFLGLKSQEKYQLNFIFGPSYESISPRNGGIVNPFTYKYSYNFGGEIKYFLSPKMSSNIGLQYNNKGFRSFIEYPVFDDTLSSTVLISAQYLTLNFDLGANFSPAFRTEYFFNAGVSYGLLVGQSFKGKRVPETLGRPDNGLYEGLSNGRSNIEWFDKNYFAAQLSVGISRYIKSRLVFTFQPTFSYQIDHLINPDGPVIPIAITSSGQPVEYSPKLHSFLLLFKLGYYFSDQIENDKKSL